MLKIQFTNIEQPSHWLVDARTHMGTNIRNELVIKSEDVLPLHAILEQSNHEKEYWLTPSEGAVVLVDGKVIIERTRVKLGQLIRFATVELKIIDPLETIVRRQHPASKGLGWIIRMASPDQDVREFSVIDALSVGRGDAADVSVNSPDVSRMHATFILRYNQLWIKDLNSLNGTFVNGQRVQDKRLTVGDVVRLHHYEFTVVSGSAEVAVHSEQEQATRVQNTIRLPSDVPQQVSQPQMPIIVPATVANAAKRSVSSTTNPALTAVSTENDQNREDDGTETLSVRQITPILEQPAHFKALEESRVQVRLGNLLALFVLLSAFVIFSAIAYIYLSPVIDGN